MLTSNTQRHVSCVLYSGGSGVYLIMTALYACVWVAVHEARVIWLLLSHSILLLYAVGVLEHYTMVSVTRYTLHYTVQWV